MSIHQGSDTLTITATGRDWVTLRQAHLAAIEALSEAGEFVGAAAGRGLGLGFAMAMRDNATPSLKEAGEQGLSIDTEITVVMNRNVFKAVFSSLDAAFVACRVDDGDPMPDDINQLIESAWLVFKTEALLAEVG